MDDGRVGLPRTDSAELTESRLRELFVYSPLTGSFYRRVTTSHNAREGTVAGSLRPDGRRQIRIDGKFYLTARLAWLYVNGRWPEGEVDHKYRDRSDDRIAHLRDATHPQNLANRGKWRSGYSRFIGISRKRNKWEARISHRGASIRIGVFDTEVDAAVAYDCVASGLYGEFASVNFFNSAYLPGVSDGPRS